MRTAVMDDLMYPANARGKHIINAEMALQQVSGEAVELMLVVIPHAAKLTTTRALDLLAQTF